MSTRVLMMNYISTRVNDELYISMRVYRATQYLAPVVINSPCSARACVGQDHSTASWLSNTL